MDILLFGMIICTIVGMKFSGKEFHSQYASKEQSSNINGIFVMLVFFSHTLGEIPSMPFSFLTKAIKSVSLQFIVVPFLFFSGYGIMTSILNKGSVYVKRMPYYRIFRTWYHFALAIVLYLIRNELIDEPRGWRNNIIGFTAWINIGCSHWYVFAILFLYISTWLMYHLAVFLNGRSQKAGLSGSVNRLTVLLVFAACLLYIVVLLLIGKDKVFFNTVVFYPVGMLFCLYKEKIDEFVLKDNKHYFIALSITLCAYLLAHLIILAEWRLTSHYNQSLCVFLAGTPFMLCILLLNMKFSLHSRVLQFLGTHVFDIYIMQRIPIKICKLYISNGWLCLVVSAAGTFLLAILFHQLTQKLDGLLGMTGKKTQSAPRSI